MRGKSSVGSGELRLLPPIETSTEETVDTQLCTEPALGSILRISTVYTLFNVWYASVHVMM